MPAEYWVREVKIAKQHLGGRIKEPKIVILGGSNGLIGIDSSLIEHDTQIKTINLSLHAGLSLNYLTRYAEPFLNNGDILIMPLEYNYYGKSSGGLQFSSWFTNNIMTWDKPFFMNMDFTDKSRFVFSVPLKRVLNGAFAKLYATRLLTKHKARHLLTESEVINKAEVILREKKYEIPNQGYTLDRLNEYGDFKANSGAQYFENRGYDIDKGFVYDRWAWQSIKNIAVYCTSKNIRLFIVWPPTIEDAQLGVRSSLTQGYLSRIRNELENIGIQTLGNPEDFSFERAYFFDTPYHLNAEGRLLRTRKLVSLLIPKLAQSKNVPVTTQPAWMHQ